MSLLCPSACLPTCSSLPALSHPLCTTYKQPLSRSVPARLSASLNRCWPSASEPLLLSPGSVARPPHTAQDSYARFPQRRGPQVLWVSLSCRRFPQHRQAVFHPASIILPRAHPPEVGFDFGEAKAVRTVKGVVLPQQVCGSINSIRGR